MNKELVQKWINALRSGKYSQGKAYLRTGNKFCCLGVLCDIANDNGWEDKNYCYSFYGETTLAPDTIWNSLGLPFALSQGYLAGKNDNGVLFGEIADIIEKYVNTYGLENKEDSL